MRYDFIYLVLLQCTNTYSDMNYIFIWLPNFQTICFHQTMYATKHILPFVFAQLYLSNKRWWFSQCVLFDLFYFQWAAFGQTSKHQYHLRWVFTLLSKLFANTNNKCSIFSRWFHSIPHKVDWISLSVACLWQFVIFVFRFLFLIRKLWDFSVLMQLNWCDKMKTHRKVFVFLTAGL